MRYQYKPLHLPYRRLFCFKHADNRTRKKERRIISIVHRQRQRFTYGASFRKQAFGNIFPDNNLLRTAHKIRSGKPRAVFKMPFLCFHVPVFYTETFLRAGVQAAALDRSIKRIKPKNTFYLRYLFFQHIGIAVVKSNRRIPPRRRPHGDYRTAEILKHQSNACFQRTAQIHRNNNRAYTNHNP